MAEAASLIEKYRVDGGADGVRKLAVHGNRSGVKRLKVATCQKLQRFTRTS